VSIVEFRSGDSLWRWTASLLCPVYSLKSATDAFIGRSELISCLNMK